MLNQEDIRREWEAGALKAPAVNIIETDDTFIMTLFMPGVKKDDVEVKVADEELLVYGRAMKEIHDAKSYIVRETEDGNYYRVFKVSDSIEAEKISAKIEDGVLTVTLPKHERVKPKEIPVEIG